MPPGQIEGRLPESEMMRPTIVSRFVLGYNRKAPCSFQKLPAVLRGLRQIGLVSSPFSVLSNSLPNIFNLSKKKRKKNDSMQIEEPIEKHSRKFLIYIRNITNQDSIILKHNLF